MKGDLSQGTLPMNRIWLKRVFTSASVSPSRAPCKASNGRTLVILNDYSLFDVDQLTWKHNDSFLNCIQSVLHFTFALLQSFWAHADRHLSEQLIKLPFSLDQILECLHALFLRDQTSARRHFLFLLELCTLFSQQISIFLVSLQVLGHLAVVFVCVWRSIVIVQILFQIFPIDLRPRFIIYLKAHTLIDWGIPLLQSVKIT